MSRIPFISLVLAFALATAYSGPMIQTGHIGPINNLAYSEENGGILFSCGDDGTLKVWDTKSSDLISSIRVSFAPISTMSLNPVTTAVAVLEITGASSSRIHVWDWKKGEKLYSVDLPIVPLFFTYSPAGTYLIYGKPEIDSLVILDAKTGKASNHFSSGFGIVSFISMSKTEKNLMTYQPTGKITYWEFQTEKKIAGYPKTTLPDLSNVLVSDSKRFVVAKSNDDLVIIDLVSGEVIDKTGLPGIVNIAISKDGKEIVALAKSNSGTQAYRFQFDGNKLTKAETQVRDAASSQIRDCLLAGKNLYLATGEGDLKLFRVEGGIQMFSTNRLSRVDDIALSEKVAAIAVRSRILVVPLSIIEGKETLVKTETGAFTAITSPFRENVGLTFIDSNRLCIWSYSDTIHKLVVYDIKKEATESEYTGFDSSIIQVYPMGQKILTLERNGNLRIVGDGQAEPFFEYSAQGLNMAVPVSKDNIIAARNKIGKNTSTLMIINSKTGETVPINEACDFCYNLMFEPSSKRLYYIGIERDGLQSMTSLRYRFGKDFENIRTIIAYRGEDFNASVAASERLLYSSLGFESIRTTDGANVENFALSSAVPRKLFLSGKMLYSLNLDRSITLYDVTTKSNLFTFYLFDDMEWVAVYPDGTYINSPNAMKYIRE